MKTDRFTDIIRRKLESIRPEFTDNDWTRMQATLQQANLPQPNAPGASQPFTSVARTSRPWMMAAASVSTVVLMAYSIWQRQEINQLRKTVRQYSHQQVGRPKSTPVNGDTSASGDSQVADSGTALPQENSNLRHSSSEKASVRPDTVYVTRYITVPAQPSPMPKENRAIQRSDASPERYAATDRTSSATTSQLPSTNSPAELNDKTFTQTQSNGTTYNESVVTTKTNNQRRERSTQDRGQNQRTDLSRANGTSPGSADNAPTDLAINTSVTPGATAEESKPAANYELVTSRPLSLETTDWSSKLVQRSKRMRSARPSLPTSVQPTMSQPVKQLAVKLRVGASTDLSLNMRSVGGVAEVLLGQHWALGVGLNRTTYFTGNFLTDIEFNKRTHRDFRREIARGIDPRRDILNIDTRTIRLQIPITLGYRIPLTKTLALQPTVGTYIDLSSTENVTFYYKEPLLGFNAANFKLKGAVDRINTFALGTNIEWHRGHWVAQAGPIANIPLQIDPGWHQTVSMGLRARALYQF
ncbi:hypothetical protein ACFSUS_20930 [Spirosoma soli]|uniref:Outer membrane protein beta-barrel domain-containing protein n=1 Tax=Spirosoma soli TaxID=1770529 RepID=A0ABW5MA75_9BACT